MKKQLLSIILVLCMALPFREQALYYDKKYSPMQWPEI